MTETTARSPGCQYVYPPEQFEGTQCVRKPARVGAGLCTEHERESRDVERVDEAVRAAVPCGLPCGEGGPPCERARGHVDGANHPRRVAAPHDCASDLGCCDECHQPYTSCGCGRADEWWRASADASGQTSASADSPQGTS